MTILQTPFTYPKKSTVRAGGTRKPFQAELSLLKKMEFVRTMAEVLHTVLESDWKLIGHKFKVVCCTSKIYK